MQDSIFPALPSIGEGDVRPWRETLITPIAVGVSLVGRSMEPVATDTIRALVPEGTRSICLYATTCGHGEAIRSDVSKTLTCLAPHFDRIVVLSAYDGESPETHDHRREIGLFPSKVRFYHLPNKLLDFGMWSRFCAGLLDAPDRIEPLERLALVNDSFETISDGFSHLFSRAERETWEFWGITDNDRFRYHLQSYFLVADRPDTVRAVAGFLGDRSLISEEAFALPDGATLTQSRMAVIARGEIQLTDFVARECDITPQCHFPAHRVLTAPQPHPEAFPLAPVRNELVNIPFGHWDRLLYLGCPVLKKSRFPPAFHVEPHELRRWVEEGVARSELFGRDWHDRRPRRLFVVDADAQDDDDVGNLRALIAALRMFHPGIPILVIDAQSPKSTEVYATNDPPFVVVRPAAGHDATCTFGAALHYGPSSVRSFIFLDDTVLPYRHIPDGWWVEDGVRPLWKFESQWGFREAGWAADVTERHVRDRDAAETIKRLVRTERTPEEVFGFLGGMVAMGRPLLERLSSAGIFRAMGELKAAKEAEGIERVLPAACFALCDLDRGATPPLMEGVIEDHTDGLSSRVHRGPGAVGWIFSKIWKARE